MSPPENATPSHPDETIHRPKEKARSPRRSGSGRNPRGKTAQKLQHLEEVLRGNKSLLIVMQNYPDPDALASAAALREVARRLADVRCTIASGGVVGRSENNALARYLRLSPQLLAETDFTKCDRIALVDTQPKTGNNSLPPDVTPHIVIDHHPIRRATRHVPFTDVRSRYGATSTILSEYLLEAGIEIERPLATGLLYGIISDTQDLGRETSRADIDAFLALYPLANQRMLSEIRNSKTPRSYFRALETALRNARVHGPCVISALGEIEVPDVVAEIADLMLRDEEAVWTFCHGVYQDRLLLSLRTADRERDAGRVMRRIVSGLGTGGGHNAMAGGQIPLGGLSAGERKGIEDLVRKRLLRVLKIGDRTGGKLVGG